MARTVIVWLMALLAAAGGLTERLDRYERRLTAAIAASESEVAADALRDHGLSLLELATDIAAAWREGQPACAPVLDQALTLRERWPLLGPASIAAEFHEAAAKLGEVEPVCGHLADLIIHPATLLVRLAHGERDPRLLRRELDETRGHLAALRALSSAAGR